jgi:hypothetical protein
LFFFFVNVIAMMPPCVGNALGVIYRLFFKGLSKDNRILLKVGGFRVHTRLSNEYSTLGVLAMLVKEIIMMISTYLGEYRPYFEVHREGSSDSDSLAALHKKVPHGRFLPERVRIDAIRTQTSLGYYVFAFLLTSSTLCIYVSMMSAVCNYIAINMVSNDAVHIYADKIGFLQDLPFVALLWGLTLWHAGLCVLMFYLVGLKFSIVFSIGCVIATITIISGMAKMLDAVDCALDDAEKRYLLNPEEDALLSDDIDEKQAKEGRRNSRQSSYDEIVGERVGYGRNS